MDKKVLLVEDHDGFRLLLGSYLSKSYDVVGVKNGLEAMGLLAKGILPDVIITDARMPEINGIQFVSNLRCSGLFKNIPVVVMSSADNEEDEQVFMQLGARDFIRKPFNPLNLSERLSLLICLSDHTSARLPMA